MGLALSDQGKVILTNLSIGIDTYSTTAGTSYRRSSLKHYGMTPLGDRTSTETSHFRHKRRIIEIFTDLWQTDEPLFVCTRGGGGLFPEGGGTPTGCTQFYPGSMISKSSVKSAYGARRTIWTYSCSGEKHIMFDVLLKVCWCTRGMA